MRVLRSFLAFVEERSMARAARRLGVPAHRIRDHVDRLEQAAGMKLLEKGPVPAGSKMGRTQLTQAGLAFLPGAVEAMRAYERMFADRPVSADPRERSRVTAMALLELAGDCLRHDLSDEDAERIERVLG